jgi:hypothetical protein
VDEAGDGHDDVVLDPSVVVGTWASASCVHRGRDELTIDVPPIAAVELRDQLDRIWQGCGDLRGDVL